MQKEQRKRTRRGFRRNTLQGQDENRSEYTCADGAEVVGLRRGSMQRNSGGENGQLDRDEPEDAKE